MADEVALLPAELDGITLEIEHIEDGLENALVKHEYPFRNGARLEPMGLKARTVTFRAYFLGGNYDAHKTLLKKLEAASASRQLVHPVYGVIYGDVEKCNCRHDDRKQCAELDITFTEGLITEAEAPARPAVGDAAQAAAVAGATKRASWLSSRISQFAKTYAKAKSKVTAFENKVASATASFDNLMSGISNPASSFTNLLNFTTDIGPSLVLSAAKAVERYGVAYQTLKSAPASFIAKLDTAFRALEDSFSSFGAGNSATQAAGDLARAAIKMSCAEAIGLASADVLAQEQALRDSATAGETAPVADADGNFAPASSSSSGNEADSDETTVNSLMTVPELENMLATSRTYLQEAVDCARANGLDPQSYKDMALALEKHVNIIKLQRENIREIELDQPTPLHIVCLRHGLPYRTAERLLPLNGGLANPNRASGALKIYTRANA